MIYPTNSTIGSPPTPAFDAGRKKGVAVDEVLKHDSQDEESVMIDAKIVRVYRMDQAQKGTSKHVIGRSPGGLSNKIHAVVDALGIHFVLN